MFVLNRKRSEWNVWMEPKRKLTIPFLFIYTNCPEIWSRFFFSLVNSLHGSVPPEEPDLIFDFSSIYPGKWCGLNVASKVFCSSSTMQYIYDGSSGVVVSQRLILFNQAKCVHKEQKDRLIQIQCTRKQTHFGERWTETSANILHSSFFGRSLSINVGAFRGIRIADCDLNGTRLPPPPPPPSPSISLYLPQNPMYQFYAVGFHNNFIHLIARVGQSNEAKARVFLLSNLIVLSHGCGWSGFIGCLSMEWRGVEHTAECTEVTLFFLWLYASCEMIWR